MARIEPLSRKSTPQFEAVYQGMIGSIGYIPNSFLTMARDPGLVEAIGKMSEAVWYPPTVPEPLRRLVTFAYSHFAGSYYSSAHCACGAEELGLAREKILSIADYETASVYSDAERAVLRLCRHAARIPGEVTDGDISALKKHFDANTIVFITGMICFMAFLNKWNEIMKTRLEDVPRAYAEKTLAAIGWRYQD
jgi:alkylhydroperoxidase family enzyme